MNATLCRQVLGDVQFETITPRMYLLFRVFNDRNRPGAYFSTNLLAIGYRGSGFEQERTVGWAEDHSVLWPLAYMLRD